ncbi:MAG: hypothetical protein ABMB14_17910 [Myxococcota bacterium]
MVGWWIAASAHAAGISGIAGVVGGGPGFGAAVSVEHARPLVYAVGELGLVVHARRFEPGSIVGVPSAMVAVPFGDRFAIGPALRADALVGGAREQDHSTGFGARYAAAVEDPLLVVVYPGVGVALRATGDGGSTFVASATFGLPFMSYDVLFPTVPTPVVQYTHASGWRLGARATRYQATIEVGRVL